MLPVSLRCVEGRTFADTQAVWISDLGGAEGLQSQFAVPHKYSKDSVKKNHLLPFLTYKMRTVKEEIL